MTPKIPSKTRTASHLLHGGCLLVGVLQLLNCNILACREGEQMVAGRVFEVR
jgi:hypothetical protein